MKIRLEEIREEPSRREFLAAPETVNARLNEGGVQVAEFRVVDPLLVDITYYLAGDDLYFNGTFATRVAARCARCLNQYEVALEEKFSFVLAPEAADPATEELCEDDLSLSYFSGNEVDLVPLCSEQALLALPTRGLCRDTCKGLCTQCGCDRNVTECNCVSDDADPRWAALTQWKSEDR